MKTRSPLTLASILLAAGCMSPLDLEEANARLEVQECSTRASAAYDRCVQGCNNENSPQDAQRTCLATADGALVDYLKGIPTSLQSGIPEELRGEIGRKFNLWTTARVGCANTLTLTERVRSDCVGADPFIGGPTGCERTRQETYAECIGTCPGNAGRGTVCEAPSATIPGWAECGAWQVNADGQCTCFSDESSNSDKSFCSEFRDAMRDPKYGTDCNGNPSDTVVHTPWVARNADRVPTGIEWKCVAWTNGRPDFRTEATVTAVEEPGVQDPTSCPPNLDRPGECDEEDGRCTVGTDADDCAAVGPLAQPEAEPEPEPEPEPQANAGACACGQTVASADRHGACDCAGSWRVVRVSDWNVDVSQVCRNGHWLTFNWAPRDGAACCGGEFSGCCQTTDPSLRCP